MATPQLRLHIPLFTFYDTVGAGGLILLSPQPTGVMMLRKEDIDDVHIMPRAATILQNTMTKITDSNNYILSIGITADKCDDYIPDLLYELLLHVRYVHEQAFRTVSCSDTDTINKSNLKIGAICQSIVNHCQHVRTPVGLGPGLYVHHKCGNKQLVSAPNSHGYSVSYMIM